MKSRAAGQNPLLGAWTTPFEMPPFDKHRDRAFHAGVRQGLCRQPQGDRGHCRRRGGADVRQHHRRPGAARATLLDRASSVFFNLAATDTNEDIQAHRAGAGAALCQARHAHLPGRDAVCPRRCPLQEAQEARAERGAEPRARALSPRLRQVRCRASTPRPRSGMAAIAARMSVLGTTFSQNLLADEQAFVMVLEGEADLAGLPEAVRAAAAQAAKERGHPGKHAITLSRSSIEPFLQYSARRDLREKAFNAWTMRGANGGKTDNRKIVAEILGLRAERAQLLGFKTAADSALEFSMAKTPAAVRKLLMEVWGPARARAGEERDQLQEAARGRRRQLQARRLGLALLRREGAQGRASMSTTARSSPTCSSTTSSPPPSTWRASCSASSFTERKDLPVYHPEVRAFEVKRDGRHVGLFLGDYFARPSKHSGAWMSGWRKQEKLGRRYHAHRRQRHELRQGRAGRADAAQHRRRAHAVPRVRPRPARPALQRHLSRACRAPAWRRISSSCPPSSTSTGCSAGGAEPLRPPLQDAASRCRRRC